VELPQRLEAARGHSWPIPADEPDIVVRTAGDNENDPEKEFPAKGLLQAMQTAMGSHGWVELRNREPLHLATGQTFDFASTQGRLVVRAAPGIVPVLEIEVTAGKPFLATGSAVHLILSGLELRVHYPMTMGGPPVHLPPVLKVAGSTQVERCAFQVVGGPRNINSVALIVDGSDLNVDRCWFQGFDKAIKVLAYNRTFALIRQTMIVPNSRPTETPAPVAESRGWGLEVQLRQGGKGSQRQLVLEDCTIEGAGLLDLASGSVDFPLQAEVKRCAVRAEALLAWKPANPEDRLAAHVQWHGEGNHLEILGHSWIVLSASEGTSALSTAVTDVESWCKAVVREIAPIRTKLKHRIDSTQLSNELRPQDFAIVAPDSSLVKVGADPNQVGPWNQQTLPP
jgi:hypothetical protein